MINPPDLFEFSRPVVGLKFIMKIKIKKVGGLPLYKAGYLIRGRKAEIFVFKNFSE